MKLSYKDYVSLENEKRYELIDGELYIIPSPNVYHQSVLGNLLYLLGKFTKKEQLVVCKLNFDRIYAPFDKLRANGTSRSW